MSSEAREAILRSGVGAWNAWRRENPEANVDLSGLELNGLDLSGANLSEVKLIEAKLVGAKLKSANLAGASLDVADLSYANLQGANLSAATLIRCNLLNANLSQCALFRTQADFANCRNANLARSFAILTSFRNADLNSANLRSAILMHAIFHRTRVSGADFSDAQVEGTVFGDLDLTATLGLESVRHTGPSTIGYDTIIRSVGRVPISFLQGTGVPDPVINYSQSLSQDFGNHFYSCFISYSSSDQECADRLREDLQRNGVRCWLASEDLKIGDPFRSRIDESIRSHDKLLLLLSEHSVHSRWVESEVEAALDKEKSSGQIVLFPMRLDDVVMSASQAWAADLRRTRHIGDLRQWQDSYAYQRSLQRLLRDLRAGETQGGR
jgi:hypothetical protein